MSNRKASSSFIIKYIEKILPGSENTKIYTRLFESMSDKQYDKFIDDLDKGIRKLCLIMPNFGKVEANVDNNLKIGDELGYTFFQQIWIDDKDGEGSYLTPIEYIVLDIPLRRASQMLIKKISIPKSSKVVDSMTGQVTGDSKGAKISYPELQICSAMGMENTMVELMKYRGGDSGGGVALGGMISKYGSANLKTLAGYATGVESTNTLKTFLSCMHLKNNIA